MPAPTTTEQRLDQTYLRTIYDPENKLGAAAKTEASRTAKALSNLDQLRKQAGNNPDLDWLQPFAEGELTSEVFRDIMACPQMTLDHVPRPMRLIDPSWSRTDQRRFIELLDMLPN